MKKHLFGYLTVALISAALGVAYGFNSGVENFYHLEMLPATLVTSSNYRNIAKGDDSEYSEWVRYDSETALDSYLWYEENGNDILSNLFLRDHVNSREKYVEMLIDHIKLAPAPLDLSGVLDDPEAKEHYIDTIVKRNEFLLSRGVPSSALTKVSN